ncbi:DUF6386 family protein [Paenibacillus xylanexedens]|uniref:DUF6386 family protein n=1 Tax=Paenibacillus xylanexedens TaxID=528191 RepID=UPI0021B4F26C|nr:DUF6386 family protein [Paenibacillus xylanexedens]
MQGTFQMDTDTATLCCYDLASLEHRLQDTPDWWSIPDDELEEVNAGHCLFLNLGEDGTYEVHWNVQETVLETGSEAEPRQVYYFQVPSGTVYLGAADDVSGGELEPDELSQGVFLQLKSGNYACTVFKKENRISVTIQPSDQGKNRLQDLIRL